jgi:hypothetical protein
MNESRQNGPNCSQPLQQPRPTLDLQPGPCDVQLQIAPIFCWRCHALVKAVHGYITHRAFVPLAQVSDTRTLVAFIVELRPARPQAFSRQPPL